MTAPIPAFVVLLLPIAVLAPYFAGVIAFETAVLGLLTFIYYLISTLFL